MSSQDVASFVLRLLGVLLLVTSIPIAMAVIADQGGPGLGPLTASVLVGVALIVWSRPLGSRIAPSPGKPSDAKALSVTDWQAIAFSAIGIMVIVRSLEAFADSYFRSEAFGAELWPWPFTAVPLLQLVVGVLLFFQGRGLAAFWRRSQGDGGSSG